MKGFNYGLINGIAMFFFPGVRRLVFYKRLAISFPFFYYWYNWGYGFGRDLMWVRGRNIIENWERDLGLRHFQTGF
jgi:hypothetical protein